MAESNKPDVDQSSANRASIPRIVDVTLDIYYSVQKLIHPPKSDKAQFIEAFKQVEKEFPELAKRYPLPENNR